MKRTVITAALWTMAAIAQADTQQVIVNLEEGAPSVGEQVSYAETVRYRDGREILEVDEQQMESALKLLNQRSEVIHAEPNSMMGSPEPPQSNATMSAAGLYDSDPDAEFNDPLFPDQYAWRNYDSESSPGASSISRAVAQSEAYEELTVVVVDGGFNDVSSFQWDDGYSFINDASNSDDDFNTAGGLEAGEQFITSADDGCMYEHGQQVASVIGGAQDDSTGNTGVVADANFYGARVLSCDGKGPTEQVADAIRWAVGESVTDQDGDSVPRIPHKADVINVSISGNGNCSEGSAYYEAIEAAREAGAIVTVASGNNGGDMDEFGSTPANCEDALTVAATGKAGERADFSNYGSAVDASASGVQVPVYSQSEGGKRIDGTSFAAPMVAGMVANLLQDVPGLSVSQMETLVSRAGNTPGDLADDGDMGSGILDANKLQQEAVDLIDPPDFKLAHPASGDCGSDRIIDQLAESQGSQVCDKREIRVNTDLEDEGQHAVIYELDQGEPMTVGDAEGIHQSSQAQRFMVDDWDASKRYGIQKCDGADGSGCDADDALIPLDMDSVATQCSD